MLVNQADNLPVMGYDAAGNLIQISLAGQMTHPGKPTSKVTFAGNLSSTATEQSVGSVKINDAAGGEHTLALKFSNTGSAEAGTWKVDVLEGSNSVASGTIAFADGKVVADRSSFQFAYKPDGLSEQTVTLDFGTDVSSFASGRRRLLEPWRRTRSTIGCRRWKRGWVYGPRPAPGSTRTSTAAALRRNGRAACC